MPQNPGNGIIRRLQLAVALDGLTISVGPGICYTPNTVRLISDGTETVTLNNPTPSTWYHAFAYPKSGGELGLEVVTTAPSEPYQGTARTKAGDSSRRYLGSMFVEASSKIRPFRHITTGDVGNRILFDAMTAAGSMPNTLLQALTGSGVQTLSLNPIIPMTAKQAILQVANMSNRIAYISRPGTGSPSATNFQLMAGPSACPVADVMLNDTQQMTIILTSAGLVGGILGSILSGSLWLFALGYIYDR